MCVMALPERLAENKCLGVIPEKKAFRGSHFCSPECHSEYRRLRRAWRASKACRLCGRHLPKQKQQKTAVLSEHTSSHSPVTPATEAVIQ